MENKLKQLQMAMNKATAEAGVMHHLLLALIAQTPNKRQLLMDFSGAVEETTVTAMNSPMPEEFVQTTQAFADSWLRIIEDEIAQEESEERPSSGPSQRVKSTGGN